MEDRLITVARLSSVAEADRAAALLRGYGIESFLKGEYESVLWGRGRVELQVRESDLDKAKEILAQSAL